MATHTPFFRKKVANAEKKSCALAFGRAMPVLASPCGTVSGAPEKMHFFGVDRRATLPVAEGPASPGRMN